MENPQTEVKPKLDPFEEVQEIISSLSYNQRYIKVYPYSHKNFCEANKLKAPYVLIYQQTEQMTIQDLICQYAKEKNEMKDVQFLFLYLKGGSIFERQSRLSDVKKQMRIDSLDGLQTCIQKVFGHINQCAYLKMSNASIQVPFIIKSINFPIYILIDVDDQFASVRTKLLKEILRIFGKMVSAEDIRITYYLDTQQRVNVSIKYSALSKHDKIEVTFKNGVELKTPPRLNNSYLIIKGNEINIKPQKLHYDDIKERKVKDVLTEIDPAQKWNQYGLKINDFVLKPEERFSKADELLRNTTAHFKNVAAVIIKEFHIFEAEQENINKICGRVDIQKIIHKDQKNMDHRKNCDQKIFRRAKKANNQYFKNIASVKPILLYTSQINVVPSEKRPISTLYRALNTFLRNQQFGSTTEDDYKQKWEYPFSNELLQQLKHIAPITGRTLWRGIRYPTIHNVGEKILYKQFSSSSTSLKQALGFAETGILKFNKSFSGRPIKDYSYYQTEDQVLFEPYVEFVVTNVGQMQNQLMPGMKISVYQLQQIEKSPVPDNKTVFILWVDDKIKQGQQFWESLKDIHKTTVMKQLLSTEELRIWLQKNQEIIHDESAQLIMITNMTRQEKGQKNGQAGVEAIKLYRSYNQTGHILLYIYDLNRALQKLQKANIKLGEKMQVSNDRKFMRKFLREVSGLR